MKLKNTTPYRTADLRAIILAAMKAEGVNPTGYIVEVGASKRQRRWWWGDPQHDTGTGENPDLRLVSGLGAYGRRWIRLGIPKAWWARDLAPDEIAHIAQVAVHEFGHNQNLRHKDMPSSYNIPVPWTEGLQVRLAEIKQKPKRDLPAEREAHARKMLAGHERDYKRKGKLIKKWRAKVRYYDRKRAAANSPRE